MVSSLLCGANRAWGRVMPSTCNRVFFGSNPKIGFGMTDGIDEPTGLENQFLKGIISLNLIHAVRV